MKKFTLVLFILVCCFGVIAQNNSIGNNDPEAKKLLDQVSNKMKTYKAIQATFTLKIEDSKGNPQGSKKGTLITKGNKYKLSITGQEIYCDGKNVWTFDKSANEVTVTKYDPASNTMTSPQRLLSNFYDKDFLYKLNGDQKIGNKTVSEIEMTPVDKTKNVFKIYLYIDKATKTLYSGKALDKNGNRYLYTINSMNGKASINDADFVFNKAKYPGVEVVDLGE
ncbi:MAG: outer membrane lipoprotein carrier protein LolA [Bacteroidetes bacterium]|nr:outer membrane lipoprotein carrier protein LolA [Bacteroidota bacterium]